MSSITKKELAETLAAKVGSKAKATELVNDVFEAISKNLAKGVAVDIAGFGKFEVRQRAARDGVNPKTKEKIKIAATKVPSFKAKKALKDCVK